MQQTTVPAWKKSPFLRLITPFFTGILVQWYGYLPVFTGWFMLLLPSLFIIAFSFMAMSQQYRLRGWIGLGIHMMLFAAGFLLTYYKNISHYSDWVNQQYHEGSAVIITIEEPLSEKARSFKTIASVQAVLLNNNYHAARGNIFLYFQKDSSLSSLHYGNQLIISKRLQPVKNTGNPGSFNYERFCAFQDVSYQVYLKPGEYSLLKIKNENVFKKFLFTIRNLVVSLVKKYIPGNVEAGLAEAMLIGYKNDLDKNLIQSYSNTGVVHIIAISGLHLAMIYWVLTLLCKPFSKFPQSKWLNPVFIIAGLWLFSLLAGGSPSVLRSAVMFTCLAIGDSMARKTSVYNALAASAFLLLCYNPFWLWDAGFQLSYAAVLGIALFNKPLINCFSIKNKPLGYLWKLNAVTISAQILTAPLIIWHFHQFPNLFLLTNLVAVPVSGLILGGELLLCLVNIVPAVAKYTGLLLQTIIRLLNEFIETINSLPGTTINHLQVSIPQMIIMYACIAGMAAWLLYKKKAGLIAGLIALLAFTGLRTLALHESMQHQKLIVYNIPQHQAIDFIDGRNYFFKGDSTILHDDMLQHFHLEDSRRLHRVEKRNNLDGLFIADHLFHFINSTIVLADNSFHIKKLPEKIPVDLIIVSQSPAITVNQLVNAFTCRKIVFDSSNPLWKVARWKQECKKLGISCHSTSEEGAFVLNLH